VGGDHAQKYLASHSAGIGAYQIAEFNIGSQYVLDLNPAYYGTKPFFDRVEIRIIPDRSTQRLQLEQGDLDIMNRGLSKEALDEVKAKGDLKVLNFPAVNQGYWSTNTIKGPFKDPELRKALVTGIDRARLAKEVYGSYATLSKQFIPAAMLEPGTGKFDPKYDPAPLKAAAAKATNGKDVDMAFLNDDTGSNQRVCELTQQMLTAAGLTGKCRGVPIATWFEWAGKPDTGSDMLWGAVNPDAVHPDTWLRIFNFTTGFINVLGGGTKQADALMDEGRSATDTTVVFAKYGAAADALAPTGDWIPVADVPEIFITQKNIVGAKYQLPTAGTLMIKDLKRTTG
jgi:peptide/nickel transport system substrate-binding protein